MGVFQRRDEASSRLLEVYGGPPRSHRPIPIRHAVIAFALLIGSISAIWLYGQSLPPDVQAEMLGNQGVFGETIYSINSAPSLASLRVYALALQSGTAEELTWLDTHGTPVYPAHPTCEANREAAYRSWVIAAGQVASAALEISDMNNRSALAIPEQNEIQARVDVTGACSSPGL
jgi:hypothetical protein